MAAVYTNVTSATHDSIALNNVKSVTVSSEVPHLVSKSDGKRSDAVVGDLGHIINVTVECEDTGVSFEGFLGKANEGDFVFTAQLDSAKTTVKIHTITDVVFSTADTSTDQGNPGGISLSGRTADEDDTHTIA